MNKSSSFTKKIIIFLVFSCFVITSAKAQEDNVKQKSEFWQKVRIGGGIGVSTGNKIFSATLAPSAIYQFDNTFALGIGLSGTYLRNKNFIKSKSTIIGASLIGLYNPINEIQLSGEFEQNNVSRNFDESIYRDENYWSPALFVGAGFRTRNITIGMKYDLLYDDNKSIYANAWSPFVRVYF